MRRPWMLFVIAIGVFAAAFVARHALLPNVVIQILGTGDFARFIRKTEVKRVMVAGPFVAFATAQDWTRKFGYLQKGKTE